VKSILNALNSFRLAILHLHERGESLPRRKVVLATGAFDLLHYGHYKFLEEAKKSGGKNAKLVVIIARDSTVEKLKGKKPIMPEDQRRALVEALKPVDEAFLGYEKMDLQAVIKKVKPDIIAVGYDQDSIFRAVKRIVRQSGLRIKVKRVKKFGPKDLNSSSKIKRKVVEGWK
jgi:FAD synthetase